MNEIIGTFGRKQWLIAAALAVAWGIVYTVGSAILDNILPKYFTDYSKTAIAARITSIQYYSHGWPRVILSDNRDVLLKIVGAGREYVQVGDSVVKFPNPDLPITVYRNYPMYVEVSAFGGGGNIGYGYSGLLKRYRIDNMPRPRATGH